MHEVKRVVTFETPGLEPDSKHPPSFPHHPSHFLPHATQRSAKSSGGCTHLNPAGSYTHKRPCSSPAPRPSADSPSQDPTDSPRCKGLQPDRPSLRRFTSHRPPPAKRLRPSQHRLRALAGCNGQRDGIETKEEGAAPLPAGGAPPLRSPPPLLEKAALRALRQRGAVLPPTFARRRLLHSPPHQRVPRSPPRSIVACLPKRREKMRKEPHRASAASHHPLPPAQQATALNRSRVGAVRRRGWVGPPADSASRFSRPELRVRERSAVKQCPLKGAPLA